MRDHVVGKIHDNVGHVFLAVEMADTNCHHGDRLLLNQKVHDGDIVRRQVPDDVGVMLEKTKVDADGIEVKDFTDLSAHKVILDFANSAGVDKGVVHHKGEPPFVCRFDQVLSVRGLESERLFHQKVLAGLQCPHAERIVGGDRRGQDYG